MRGTCGQTISNTIIYNIRPCGELAWGHWSPHQQPATALLGLSRTHNCKSVYTSPLTLTTHRTITAIYPNPLLLASAAEAVTALLRSSSHNLKYVGLDALAGITRISPKYAMEHQVGLRLRLTEFDQCL